MDYRNYNIISWERHGGTLSTCPNALSHTPILVCYQYLDWQQEKIISMLLVGDFHSWCLELNPEPCLLSLAPGKLIWRCIWTGKDVNKKNLS